MSWRKALWALGFVAGVLLAAPSLRAQGNYLDVYIAKVKPEKAADAEAIARKIADANRHNNGDHVIVNKFAYHFRQPTRGEVFVFTTKNIRGIEADGRFDPKIVRMADAGEKPED